MAQARANDDGAAAVEFALVALILVTLLVGIIQFAFVFSQWLQIEHAAREGVRWASLRNSAAAVRGNAIAAAPGVALAPGDVTIVPADPFSAPQNTTISVTVRTNAVVFMPLMSGFLGPTVPLSATAVQRVE